MGRGSSKAGGAATGGGGTFSSAEDFEKSLSGFDDPRLKEYTEAYEEESKYNDGLKKNLNRSIDEDGYDEESIAREERYTNSQLNKLPKQKTPRQLGEEEALKERLKILDELKKRKGEKGQGRGNTEMVNEKRR